MDQRNFDIRAINLFLSPDRLQRLKGEMRVRPVERAIKANFWSDSQKDRRGLYFITNIGMNEEHARLAAEIMAEHLRGSPELESTWRYDQENKMLVVEIKNRLTGQVLRQIPPEEILFGSFVPEKDASGNIINKTA